MSEKELDNGLFEDNDKSAAFNNLDIDSNGEASELLLDLSARMDLSASSLGEEGIIIVIKALLEGSRYVAYGEPSLH